MLQLCQMPLMVFEPASIPFRGFFSGGGRMSQRFALSNKILVPLSVFLGLLGWQLTIEIGDFPAFILPAPQAVGQRWIEALLEDHLLWHVGVTLSEVMLGLGLGLSTAVLLGYFLARQPWLEQILAPFIVASQSIPVVAVAPLLIIWFGPGILSKILITALIVFFPILINTIVGIRSVPEQLYDLLHSYEASNWQILRFLEIPAALPVFFGGLRIGATLAVIGAVVGEFVGADQGVGFLINIGRGMYDTALVFVAIFMLVGMAVGFYGLVDFLEKRLLSWQR